MLHSLYLFSTWLHLLAVAAWLGGSLFLVLVVVPVVRSPSPPPGAAAFMHRAALRFRTVGWYAFLTLGLTGTYNLAYRGVGWADLGSATFWSRGFGAALGLKLSLFGLVLLLSVVHDFFVGPRATALWREAPDSPTATRWRRSASWMGRLNLLLALAIVSLAVVLVRGWPN